MSSPSSIPSPLPDLSPLAAWLQPHSLSCHVGPLSASGLRSVEYRCAAAAVTPRALRCLRSGLGMMLPTSHNPACSVASLRLGLIAGTVLEDCRSNPSIEGRDPCRQAAQAGPLLGWKKGTPSVCDRKNRSRFLEGTGNCRVDCIEAALLHVLRCESARQKELRLACRH